MLCFLNPVLACFSDENSNGYQGNEPSGASGEAIPLSSLGKAAIGLTVKTVAKESLPLEIAVPGKIEVIPTRQFDQHAPLSGRISRVNVYLGQTIREGDILAVVDSPEMNQLAAEMLQSKQQLESDYAKQKTILDEQVRQAEARLALADANHKRNLKLLEDRIAAQKDVQQSLAEIEVAEARLKTALKERDITLAAIAEKIKLTVEPIHQRLVLFGVDELRIKEMLTQGRPLTSVPVHSARSGVISALHASAGESINPSVSLFTVSDLNKVWATANVYEDDMARMRTGQKVRIKIHALGNELLTGVLTFIGHQVDPLTKTLPVRAELDNPGLRLKPDMFAQLYIQTADPGLAILLPYDAVIQRGGHSLVFLETQNGFQPAYVKVGRSFGDKVEIEEGLAEGQRIVVQGAFQLAAEMLKSHGNLGLFVQPTENERFAEGYEQSKNTGSLTLSLQAIMVIALIAFLVGFAVSGLYSWGKSVKEPNLSTTSASSENLQTQGQLRQAERNTLPDTDFLKGKDA